MTESKAIFAAVGYAVLTGLINLVFSRKSQINAWCLANPRLAAFAKLMRAVGLDSNNLWAFATLLIAKRLPAIQLPDSPVAKAEQRKADAKALRDNDRDPPGDSPAEPVPHSVRSSGGTDALMGNAGEALAAVVLWSLVLVPCILACDHDARPCSAEDLATGPLAAHNSSCAVRRQAAFPNLPDDACDAEPGCKAIVDECDRWSEERCK